MRTIAFEITTELLGDMLNLPRGIEIAAIRKSDMLHDAFTIRVRGDGLPEEYEHTDGDAVRVVCPMIRHAEEAISWEWP